MEINALSVSVSGKNVLETISISLKPGTVHALMGPNGSGKSSLACTLIGHPAYQVTQGLVTFNGHDLLSLAVEKRAQQGLFLAFQHPVAIPGVTVMQFLHEAYRAVCDPSCTIGDFYAALIEAMDLLEIEYEFAERPVHQGFSGGQKKKIELLQLLLLKPKIAILDELDSGLDVDALKIVARALAVIREQCPQLCLLIISHYQPLFEYIVPDQVHVLMGGRIVRTGDQSLAHAIKERGYDAS